MSANVSAAAGAPIPRRAVGWRMGLANMLGKELAAWWRTRRGWVQCLVALLLLNGDLAVNLRGSGVGNATMAFLVTAALCVPIAAVSLAQDSISGDKHSRTACPLLRGSLARGR